MGKLWKKWSEEGIKLPFLYDPVSGKPSITLGFAYISFVICFVSVICLHVWPETILGSVSAIMVWIIATILYMIRKLNKAKFDLDDKSFEIESPEEKEKNEDSVGN